jgi:hypothetical protein
VKRLLQPFADLQEPTFPLTPLDTSLQAVAHELSRIPSNLFDALQAPLEEVPACPLDDSAPDQIRIECRNSLNQRLKDLELYIARTNPSQLMKDTDIPTISLSGPGSPTTTNDLTSEDIVTSELYRPGKAHPSHASSLLRLLYLHTSINPGNASPHIPSLLVPLYSVVCQEADADELAHVEADTFWLFEALIGEFSELEDEADGNLWMKKLGERVRWSDSDLYEKLVSAKVSPFALRLKAAYIAIARTRPCFAALLIVSKTLSR